MSGLGALAGRVAVVHGGGGSLGGAIAVELAAQGAEVFVAGRSTTGVDAVAARIEAAGGTARPAVVDALDATAVAAHVEAVVGRAGRIDVQVNATGPRVGEFGHGRPVLELSAEELLTPVDAILRSQFLTARAAARPMVERGSGVLVFLTAIPGRVALPGSAAVGAAYAAVEALMRSLAVELGPAGVRAVALRTTANPDTRSIRETVATRAAAGAVTPEQVVARLTDGTMLKALPRAADTARAAAYLASDAAAFLTGTVLNASAGAAPD